MFWIFKLYGRREYFWILQVSLDDVKLSGVYLKVSQ